MSGAIADGEAIAWAAGFFDGDGGFTLNTSGGRLRLVAGITQSPEEPDAVPAALDRFRGAVNAGVIYGPNLANGAFLWQTTTTSRTIELFTLLRPWLSRVKVNQFEAALDRVIDSHRQRRRPLGPRSVEYRAVIARLEHTRDDASSTRPVPRRGGSELAWAAGFFDAEGSTCVSRTKGSRGDVLKIQAKAGQATEDGSIADVLLRFRDAVGFGYFNGPYVGRGRLPYYTWQVAAFADVVRLRECLDPWLGLVKKQQADAALDAFIRYRGNRSRGADSLPRLLRRDPASSGQGR